MSNATNSGKELQKQDSSLSGSNSTGSCSELRAWVALELQVMKELVPAKEMSDEAARAMLDMAEDAAAQVGKERFHDALVKAMTLAGQFRPTIGTIRRCCGLIPRLGVNEQAVAAAWSMVTTVVTKHLGVDGNGNRYLAPWLRRDGYSGAMGDNPMQLQSWKEEPVPAIPASVVAAVKALGGWGALADAHPQWWPQRFEAFKQLWQPDPDEIAELLSPAPSTSIAKIQP
jgi:hypothetical protein